MIAPSSVEVVAYDGIGGLPHFNPDLDEGTPPEVVRKLRAEVARADALMISSPEYAHGVPERSRTRSTGWSAVWRSTASRWHS